MVTIAQGEVWWADLGEPLGSAPGFRRPVLVVQGDALNRSRVATVVCVPLNKQHQVGRRPEETSRFPPGPRVCRKSR